MAHHWTIPEDWATLHLYLQTGESPAVNDSGVLALRDAMIDCPAESIVMRVRNFAYLDTGVGLRNAAVQSAEVWNEYADDPDGGAAKARSEFENVTGISLD